MVITTPKMNDRKNSISYHSLTAKNFAGISGGCPVFMQSVTLLDVSLADRGSYGGLSISFEFSVSARAGHSANSFANPAIAKFELRLLSKLFYHMRNLRCALKFFFFFFLLLAQFVLRFKLNF